MSQPKESSLCTPYDALKPCPFCGCSGDFDNGDSRGEWIACQNCGARSPTFQFREHLVSFWNSRYAPSETVPTVPRLWGPQDHKTVLERIAYLLRQGGHADYADAVHRIFEAVTTSLPHAYTDRKGVVHVTMNNGDSWWFKDGQWNQYVKESA